MSDETRAEIESLLATVIGRKCPRCGRGLIHYRLFGYRCPARCNPLDERELDRLTDILRPRPVAIGD